MGDLVLGDSAPVDAPGAGCASAGHPTAPRRVLYVSGRMARASAETLVIEQYRRLDRNRLQFDFVVFNDDRYDCDDEIAQLGGRTFGLPPTAPGHVSRRFFALIVLLRRHPEIEVVHSHTLLASAQFLLAAALVGGRTQIACANSAIDLSSQGLMPRIYYVLSVIVFHYIITILVSCGAEATRYLFPWRSDVRLLPNGIDLDPFVGSQGERKPEAVISNPSGARNPWK